MWKRDGKERVKLSGKTTAEWENTWNTEGRDTVMKYEKIRKQVIEAVFEAQEQGLIKGTSGNIAVRDDRDDVIAITPSGVPYKGMTEEDIAIVDLNGRWLEGRHRPSSEVPMHTAVYRARPDVRATVHTHAMFAVIMAMDEQRELRPVTRPHCEFTPVPVVPFSLPGSEEGAQMMVEALGAEGRAVLIRNHGMFCCGKNIRAAMEATEYTEEMAKTTYYARLLGTYKPLSEEEERAVKAFLAEHMTV